MKKLSLLLLLVCFAVPALRAQQSASIRLLVNLQGAVNPETRASRDLRPTSTVQPAQLTVRLVNRATQERTDISAQVLSSGIVTNAESVTKAVQTPALQPGEYTLMVMMPGRLPLVASEPMKIESGQGESFDYNLTHPESVVGGAQLVVDGKVIMAAGELHQSSDSGPEINAMDVYMVRLAMVSNDPELKAKADLNFDGKVDEQDITIVLENNNRLLSAPSVTN